LKTQNLQEEISIMRNSRSITNIHRRGLATGLWAW